jgi:hypothetical protein
MIVGMNGLNEHFIDSSKSSKGYNNNLHYSINELITSRNDSNHHQHDVIKANVKR